ncbi:GSCOCG00010643001-RA-CDS [Cotesia congregata]|nr:GSCOCG00010643001-RA-CDS [Cotesia congregata]
MIWSCIIFSILLSTNADQQSTENIIKEAQQKIMVFLKEPAGVSWLTSLTQRQKSPLRTSELLTSILDKSCPAGPETKSAASKLQELLTTDNATRIEFEGWKDLMDNGPQDDVICLYRALNTTLNHTEDWQKFLTSVSEGYMVYLALDMGTKYIICLKKIPAQTRIDPTTEVPPTTTPEAPGPTSPPPCNRPIIYVLPVNYPLHAFTWYPSPQLFYQKNGPQNNFGPYVAQSNFGPYVPQSNPGYYYPSAPQRPEVYRPQNIGTYGNFEPYKNFGPVMPTQGSFEPTRTTKPVRPNFMVPMRRSPFTLEKIGPTGNPGQPRHWQVPPKCDKNTWRPECFWKPAENRHQAPISPTMIDNNFGYRKTLPVKESMKENPMLARFWKKIPQNQNWVHKKLSEIQAPMAPASPMPGPISTGSVPWIVYNQYSVKYPPGTPLYMGQNYWQGRTRPVPGIVSGPMEGRQDQAQHQGKKGKGCKNCLCNLCDRPIIVKVLMDNAGKMGPIGDSRRSIDPKTIAEVISKTDQSLEEVERQIHEIEGESNESEIEESTESSEV